jgi:hypothetical protein
MQPKNELRVPKNEFMQPRNGFIQPRSQLMQARSQFTFARSRLVQLKSVCQENGGSVRGGKGGQRPVQKSFTSAKKKSVSPIEHFTNLHPAIRLD